MNILAVGAHPDDVEICCFGTLARCTERGDVVVVCSTSNGNLGHGTIPPEQLRLVRLSEAARAAEVIGASFCTLDCDDLHVEASHEELRMKMVEIIRSVRPDVIFTHCPEDSHPDHVQTSLLVLSAAFQATIPHIHSRHPSCTVEPLIYYMDTLGGNFIPNEFVDITASLQRKREAVSCHASQIDWLLEHDHVHLLQATEIISSYRGMQSGCNAAEAFALCPVRKATTRRMLP